MTNEEDARIANSIRASMRGDCYLTAKPSTCKTLTEVYEFFNRTFGTPGSVYYPGCDLDITPIASFPSSKVILLDINKKADLKRWVEKLAPIVHTSKKQLYKKFKYYKVYLSNKSIIDELKLLPEEVDYLKKL